MKMSVPNWVISICQTLKASGETGYVVGGAVRDTIIGRPVHEYDMCSSAAPKKVHMLFEKAIDTGAAFGTVTVLVRDENGQQQSAEITAFRTETDYSDSRRPDAVVLGVTLEEDLGRRDFTINALAYDPLEDTLVDLHQGQADINAKCLRTIGKPEDRFREDTLRLFRAARFVSQLGFELEKKTETAILTLGPSVPLPAEERMCIEVKKTLVAPSPKSGLDILKASKLLERYMPGIVLDGVALNDIEDAPEHHRLAKLLCKTPQPEKVLKQARFSNAEIDLVVRQLERHFDDEMVALDPHDLNIKSADLMAEGLEGPKLGAAQKSLFKAVCQRHVPNQKAALLNYFKTQIQGTL